METFESTYLSSPFCIMGWNTNILKDHLKFEHKDDLGVEKDYFLNFLENVCNLMYKRGFANHYAISGLYVSDMNDGETLLQFKERVRSLYLQWFEKTLPLPSLLQDVGRPNLIRGLLPIFCGEILKINGRIPVKTIDLWPDLYLGDFPILKDFANKDVLRKRVYVDVENEQIVVFCHPHWLQDDVHCVKFDLNEVNQESVIHYMFDTFRTMHRKVVKDSVKKNVVNKLFGVEEE